MEGMNWRKSSYSGNSGGNCTEVATVPGAVLVRDSKDPAVPARLRDAGVGRVRGSGEGRRAWRLTA